MRSHVIVFAWLQMVLASILTVVAIVAGSMFLAIGNMVGTTLQEAPEPLPVSQSVHQAKPAASPKPAAIHTTHQSKPAAQPKSDAGHSTHDIKSSSPPAAPEMDKTVVYNVPLLSLNTGGLLIFVSVVLCALSIAAGVGLLRFAPWGRSLGIAVAILDILAISPITLALGVYGLIILLNRETAELFQHETSPGAYHGTG
jgi:hypothetical protein